MALSAAEKTRRHREKKLAEIEKMPKIKCACGCGKLIAPLTKQFKPAKFALGHNPGREGSQFKPGHATWNKGKPNPVATATHKGKKLSADEIARRTATRLANNGGVYQKARGWSHTPETIEKMKVVNSAKALKGEANPMFGKKHSAESRAKNAAAHSGDKSPTWRGGVGTLPYGPEFTRKFKKIIRDRDQHTCQRCGVHQSELKYTIHVHHLDFDKMNNDPVNLVTACNGCNNWANFHPDEPFVNPDVWARTHSK